MRKVEKRHPSILVFALAVACSGAVVVATSIAPALHLHPFAASALSLGVLSALAVFFLLRRDRLAFQRFERIPLRRIDQLSPGHLVRVRVIIQEPTTLRTPIEGTACVYYRAAALVPNIDPYEAEPDEAAVAFEGEVAIARDSSGTLLLDLRRGADTVGSSRLPGVRYEHPRANDPLQVGISEPYAIDLQLIPPGLEIEAVGVVELADGTPTLHCAGRPLQIRVVRSA